MSTTYGFYKVVGGSNKGGIVHLTFEGAELIHGFSVEAFSSVHTLTGRTHRQLVVSKEMDLKGRGKATMIINVEESSEVPHRSIIVHLHFKPTEGKSRGTSWQEIPRVPQIARWIARIQELTKDASQIAQDLKSNFTMSSVTPLLTSIPFPEVPAETTAE